MFFKKSAKSIIKQLSSAMVDSVDNIMDKVISIYTNTDEELLERATPEKILDFSFETMVFCTHIADIVLFRRRPEIREDVIHCVYDSIAKSYDLLKIDMDFQHEPLMLIIDRMNKYACTVSKSYEPAMVWQLGETVPDDPFSMTLYLYGDYITYFREYGKIPYGEEISTFYLTDVLDCEFLVFYKIVYNVVVPEIHSYINQLDKIII